MKASEYQYTWLHGDGIALSTRNLLEIWPPVKIYTALHHPDDVILGRVFSKEDIAPFIPQGTTLRILTGIDNPESPFSLRAQIPDCHFGEE